MSAELKKGKKNIIIKNMQGLEMYFNHICFVYSIKYKENMV